MREILIVYQTKLRKVLLQGNPPSLAISVLKLIFVLFLYGSCYYGFSVLLVLFIWQRRSLNKLKRNTTTRCLKVFFFLICRAQSLGIRQFFPSLMWCPNNQTGRVFQTTYWRLYSWVYDTLLILFALELYAGTGTLWSTP